MATYKATGRVVSVGQTVQFASGFTKREVVLDLSAAGANYKNTVPFTFKKDRTEKLEGVNVGDGVEVTFGIDGREWEKDGVTRYFTDLTGIEITITEKAAGVTEATLEGAKAKYLEVFPGKSDADFKAYAKDIMPGKNTPERWATVIAKIEEERMALEAQEGEDIPF